MPIVECPAYRAVEVVPAFGRLRTAEHGSPIDELRVARGTSEDRCRGVRLRCEENGALSHGRLWGKLSVAQRDARCLLGFRQVSGRGRDGLLTS